MTDSGSATQESDILERLESVILGEEPELTRLEVVERAGVSLEFADQLWRALGFASPGNDERVFNDADVRALEILKALAKLGAVDSDNVASLARSIGQSYARLAEWQARMVSGLLERAGDDLDTSQLLKMANDLLPLMSEMQTYVWRRHLATAAGRMLAHPVATAKSSLIVGFADIVNYTSMSRRIDEPDLEELIEHFEATTSAVVATHGGRVVKTIGDEIMFVTDLPTDGAKLALEIAARSEDDSKMPRLRIGLAFGQVLSRLGDVYGPVVNMASRLTSVARPGTVVVDRVLADELADDAEVKLRRMRRVTVRGYARLEPWVLRPSPPSEETT